VVRTVRVEALDTYTMPLVTKMGVNIRLTGASPMLVVGCTEKILVVRNTFVRTTCHTPMMKSTMAGLCVLAAANCGRIMSDGKEGVLPLL
jgi:hypothetical protein